MTSLPPQTSPSLPTADDGGAADSISRTSKSVQFSAQPPPQKRMASSNEVSPRGGAERRANPQAESSGDEITPLAPHERGSKGRSYDSASKGNEPATAAAEQESQGDAGSKKKARRRRRRWEGDGDRGSGRDGWEEEEEEGWWSRVVEKFGSVELDNKGSVARDHLALERTFLAWLRTSLSFAGIGIAITQLFRLNTSISQRNDVPSSPPDDHVYHIQQLGKPLGATFLGIAILVLAVGGRRYFESQYWIIRGKFPASRGSVFLITAVAVSLIVTSLVVVVSVDPRVFEKKKRR